MFGGGKCECGDDEGEILVPVDRNEAGEDGEMVEVEDLLVGAEAERITAQALLEESAQTDTLEETVQNILKRQRDVIRESMDGYSFHPALKAK